MNNQIQIAQDEVLVLQSQLKTVETQLDEKSKQLLLKDLFNKINSGEYELSQIDITKESFYDTEKFKDYKITIRGEREGKY